MDDTLFVVVFDPATLELTGEPVPVVQNLYRNDWSANYAVANNGTLVYLNSSGSFQDRRLVWIDRTGQVEPINVPVAEYAYAVLSPDGTRIALDSRNDEDDIWIFDLERETLQRLTTDPGENRAPIWLPDGRVAFTREIGESQEVYIQAADGSGDIEQLTTGSDSTSYPTDVSADGKTLFYRNSSIPADVWQVPIGEGVQRGEPIIAGPDSQRDATLSPNGRWLAYQSNESGQAEIYVRPYPDIDSARILISRDGGSHPLWSKDGSELFYLTVPIGTGGALVTVTVDTGSSFSAGLPEQIFEDVFISPIQGRQVYDVSEDGQRFLMLQAPGQGDYQNVVGDIIFVQNWFEELNRLVPTE